jgi:hypothetical protein
VPVGGQLLGGLERLPDGLFGRVEQSPGAVDRSVDAVTTASGRSWLMWAFIPARANWIGSIPGVDRDMSSGFQATGGASGEVVSESTAEK